MDIDAPKPSTTLLRPPRGGGPSLAPAPKTKPPPLKPGRPRPAALQLPVSSTSRNLHLSPSAPNLRLSSTAAIAPPPSWASSPPPSLTLASGGKHSLGKRNAKGLSLSLGLGSSSSSGSGSSTSGGSEASSSSGPGIPRFLSPSNPTNGTGGGLYGRNSTSGGLLTSIPPPTPSSSHFETSFRPHYQQPPVRPSLISLLPTNERDPTDAGSFASGGGTRAYAEGPIEVIPGLYIGNEENARDLEGLARRGIRRVVNVAKELVYDEPEQPSAVDLAFAASGEGKTSFIGGGGGLALRPAASTPNLKLAERARSVSGGGGGAAARHGAAIFRTVVVPGREDGSVEEGRADGGVIEQLHLPWSHGQADLVSGEAGFVKAGDWVAEGLLRSEGVMVHCQCGISRSATLVIAIVMRFAAEGTMPTLLGGVRGMHDAYEFVKLKSPWIGPNVSLIYQLLEWERYLATQTAHLPHNQPSGSHLASSSCSSPSSVTSHAPRGFSSSEVESEEEWSRRRAELEALEEAEDMDRQMEERIKRTRATVGAVEADPTAALNAAAAVTAAPGSASSSPCSSFLDLGIGAGKRPSTASSSSSSASSTGGMVVVGAPPMPIKRRISASSLASEITFEDDVDAEEEKEDEEKGCGSRSSERRGATSMEVGTEPMEGVVVNSEEAEEEPLGFGGPPSGRVKLGRSVGNSTLSSAGGGGSAISGSPLGSRSRKRSATINFTPSLDPLPSSPVDTALLSPNATGDSGTSTAALQKQQDAAAAAVVGSSSTTRQRSQTQSHRVHPYSSALPSSPSTGGLSPSPGFSRLPLPSTWTAPSSPATTVSSSSASSSRRSSLSASTCISSLGSIVSHNHRPPPILPPPTEPPRSLQQLLFFPPSPNHSLDPATPTMRHSVSMTLDSPAAMQPVFFSLAAPPPPSASLSSSASSTEQKTPTVRVPRLRSLPPAFGSPSESTAAANQQPPLSSQSPRTSPFGGSGFGFGAHQSPKQRKDAHRRAFSVDVSHLPGQQSQQQQLPLPAPSFLMSLSQPQLSSLASTPPGSSSSPSSSGPPVFLSLAQSPPRSTMAFPSSSSPSGSSGTTTLTPATSRLGRRRLSSSSSISSIDSITSSVCSNASRGISPAPSTPSAVVVNTFHARGAITRSASSLVSAATAVAGGSSSSSSR